MYRIQWIENGVANEDVVQNWEALIKHPQLPNGTVQSFVPGLGWVEE